MPNPISKVAAIILAVILTVIVPIYNQFWMIDRTVYNQVNVVTNRFQKEVRTRGYVNKEIYENFMRDLSNTGRIYDVEMLHRKTTYYPLSPTSPGYTADKPWTVEFFKYTDKDILGTVYNKAQPKDYKMQPGDDFTVSVRDKNQQGIRIFWKHIGGNKTDQPLIIASYGGMIENEAN